MRITTKGRYGLRAVASLAMSTHTRPVSINTIASGENVSSEFLEQIFYKLKKAGVIRSIRGPGGGFVLARKPEEITVKDILEAVGEMGGLTPCTLRRRMLCSRVRVPRWPRRASRRSWPGGDAAWSRIRATPLTCCE